MDKKILLIGDEPRYYTLAVINLKEKYEVDHIKYIRTAFVKRLQRYRLIIIEIMTPSLGLYTKKETKDDLMTGIVFYEREIEKLGIPVLFWSWSDEFLHEIEARKNPLLGFVHKTMEENFLVEAVDKMLENMK